MKSQIQNLTDSVKSDKTTQDYNSQVRKKIQQVFV